MRDINAGRDIINSNIIEYVGANPSREILQHTAEELAEAEKRSKRIVKSERRDRTRVGVIFASLTLACLSGIALLGYYWLLDSGKLTLSDLAHDVSNDIIAAYVCIVATALVGVACAVKAESQLKPTRAERLNKERLGMVDIRWRELKGLGLDKKEIKRYRE